MLDKLFRRRIVIRRFRSGPTGPYIDDFAALLRQRGYARKVQIFYLRTVVRLGHWLSGTHRPLRELDEQVLAEFISARRKRLGVHLSTIKKAEPAAIRHFLALLREKRIVPSGRQIVSHAPALLVEFETWLVQQRGTSARTIRFNYHRQLLQFLDAQGLEPEKYDVQGIRALVLERTHRESKVQIKRLLTALRTFFRFLALTGRCSPRLAEAVPRTHQWSQTSLPRFLASEDVERIIAACDLSNSRGRRNRAVLLLLSRLALRAIDVANLTFSDVDWRNSTLRVRGKTRTEVLLPLPQDVGDAILSYLRDGRPQSEDQHLFLTCTAPIRPLSARGIPGMVVTTAAAAGVSLPRSGSHILRHSRATSLLGDGVSLSSIATLLRHRSLETTAMYAKVDIGLLETVVQPWPLEVSS